MPRNSHGRQGHMLSAAPDQPLVGVIEETNGQRIVRYSAGSADQGDTQGSDQTLQDALAVIGAWSDLDWDALADDLDRLRHEQQPTPPIDL